MGKWGTLLVLIVLVTLRASTARDVPGGVENREQT